MARLRSSLQAGFYATLVFGLLPAYAGKEQKTSSTISITELKLVQLTGGAGGVVVGGSGNPFGARSTANATILTRKNHGEVQTISRSVDGFLSGIAVSTSSQNTFASAGSLTEGLFASVLPNGMYASASAAKDVCSAFCSNFAFIDDASIQLSFKYTLHSDVSSTAASDYAESNFRFEVWGGPRDERYSFTVGTCATSSEQAYHCGPNSENMVEGTYAFSFGGTPGGGRTQYGVSLLAWSYAEAEFTTAVPEPASVLLMTIGAFCLGGVVILRKSAA